MINEENNWQEHWLSDIEFYFRIKSANDVVVDFEAYDVYYYDDGNGYHLKFKYYDSEGEEFYTSDPNQCVPYVKGYIKWDGCSEIDFAKSIHSCGGRSSLVRLGELFEQVFSAASGMLNSDVEYL